MKKEKNEKEVKETSIEKANDIIVNGGDKKKTIITLIIGILIGAVITAAIFLITKPKGRNIPDFSQFEKNGERVKPNGENFDFDFSKEGRSRPNRDKKVDDSKTEDNSNEDKA